MHYTLSLASGHQWQQKYLSLAVRASANVRNLLIVSLRVSASVGEPKYESQLSKTARSVRDICSIHFRFDDSAFLSVHSIESLVWSLQRMSDERAPSPVGLRLSVVPEPHQ